MLFSLSRTTVSRVDHLAREFEFIDLSAHLDALRVGENVLAIHGLNRQPRDEDFYLFPELLNLHSTGLQPTGIGYFAAPSPGWPSDVAFSRLAETPRFSLANGLLTGPELLELSVNSEAAEIRFTTDGTRPNRFAPLYTEPIQVERGIAVRAQVFEADRHILGQRPRKNAQRRVSGAFDGTDLRLRRHGRRLLNPPQAMV